MLDSAAAPPSFAETLGRPLPLTRGAPVPNRFLKSAMSPLWSVVSSMTRQGVDAFRLRRA
jgi:hypothetical protein